MKTLWEQGTTRFGVIGFDVVNGKASELKRKGNFGNRFKMEERKPDERNGVTILKLYHTIVREKKEDRETITTKI